MASDAGNHGERQRRELDEIRRSFHEGGPSGGALFEPAQHNGSSAGQQALPAPPATAKAPPAKAPPATAKAPPAMGRPAWVVALVAACLLVGGGLGYLLHPPAAGPAWPAVTSIVTRTAPAPRARVVAPPACLQTAQRADQVIDLFTRNVRDRRLSLALKAYTDASQACRKEASP
jgi:hypothetical protein